MADWGIIAGVLGAVAIALAIVAWRLYAEAVAARRERYIRTYVFTGTLLDKLKEKHKHLELKDCHLVARALREFFLTHLKSGRRYVGMPSRVVDDLWHEFIVDTQEYSRFCQAAFGRYFHHTPASSMGKTKDEDAGLRITWRYACIEENIDWRKPTSPMVITTRFDGKNRKLRVRAPAVVAEGLAVAVGRRRAVSLVQGRVSWVV